MVASLIEYETRLVYTTAGCVSSDSRSPAKEGGSQMQHYSVAQVIHAPSTAAATSSSANTSTAITSTASTATSAPSTIATRDKGAFSTITLTAQCSLDRWPRIAQQASCWGGPASIAVYIPAPSSSPYAALFEEHLRGLVQDYCQQNPQQALTVSALYANHLAKEGSGVLQHKGVPRGLNADYDELYPINALRNLAVRHSGTELVLFCDGDFIPSEGLHDYVVSKVGGL